MKQTKKIAALLLASAMAAGTFAGCGSSGGASAGPVLDETLASEDFAYPMTGDHSLTYWCELSTNVSANFPSLNDTEFAKGLMERTGVNIEFQHPPTGGTDEQFNLIIADGELPDLLEYKWQSYPGGPQKAIDDGYIYALNDIIDQYCPNLKAYLEAHPEVDRQCKTDEGNYYAFPFIRGDDKLRVTQGLMIRQDWLDELNLDIPTTIDDWHTVLTAFKEEKGAVAPFSYEYTVSLLYENEAFVYAFDTARGFYVGDDGKVHYGAAEDNYKDYLATMHQWYSEGLIDPDIATATLDQVSAKMTNGSSGASYGYAGSRLGTWTLAATETNPDYELSPCPVPVLNEGDTPRYGQMENSVPAQGNVAITTCCDDVAAAARLLDWAYSDEGHLFYNFGVEGESYTMENGVPTYTDFVLHNPDGWGVTQAMSKYTRCSYNGPFVQDLGYLEQYYTLDGQIKAVDVWKSSEAAEHIMPPITPTSEESTEFSAIVNEMTTCRNEMTLKFILGTESLDNFDAYVQTLNQMGLERALEIENAALERYNDR